MTALLTETTRHWTTRLNEELRQQEAKGERLKRQLLREVVWGADALAGITLSAWKWVCETLEGEGFEGRELARYCEVLLEAIDGGLTGYERLLALAEASDLTPEAVGLLDLEAKLPALREARPKVAGMLALATRQPRPVDETVLAESRSAIERGEFVMMNDDYVGRVQAGEDF